MVINRLRVAVAFLATSAIGLINIVSHEGYTPVAVPPVPGDVCTVGFGTTAGVKCGQTITPPQALARVQRDIEKFEGALSRCVRVPLYQHEYDAYVSFAYNVGEQRFCSSTMVRLLNAGDYAGACGQMSRFVCGPRPPPKDPDQEVVLDYCARPDKMVLPGLVKRRERERLQCLGQQPEIFK